jgi:hypothetical protein
VKSFLEQPLVSLDRCRNIYVSEALFAVRRRRHVPSHKHHGNAQKVLGVPLDAFRAESQPRLCEVNWRIIGGRVQVGVALESIINLATVGARVMGRLDRSSESL